MFLRALNGHSYTTKGDDKVLLLIYFYTIILKNQNNTRTNGIENVEKKTIIIITMFKRKCECVMYVGIIRNNDKNSVVRDF